MEQIAINYPIAETIEVDGFGPVTVIKKDNKLWFKVIDMAKGFNMTAGQFKYCIDKYAKSLGLEVEVISVYSNGRTDRAKFISEDSLKKLNKFLHSSSKTPPVEKEKQEISISKKEKELLIDKVFLKMQYLYYLRNKIEEAYSTKNENFMKFTCLASTDTEKELLISILKDVEKSIGSRIDGLRNELINIV